MQVEFIGCTGAGKTTLISAVHGRLAKTEEVTTSFDFVAAPLGLRGVTHPTVQNLIQEVVGVPFFIRSLYRHKAFVVFTLRMLARHSNFTFFTLNNLRSLERKIGVYEIIRRYEGERIVLVDEGTVLSAHNVFVYPSAVYTSEEIAKFASLVPLPDIIVYIKVPVDILIKRSLLRDDPPREMKSKNRTLIEKYIVRAATMFDQLVEAENIQCRLMIVEYHDFIKYGHDTVVDRITDFVLDKKISYYKTNPSH